MSQPADNAAPHGSENIDGPPQLSQDLEPPKLCQIACHAAKSDDFNGIPFDGENVGLEVVGLAVFVTCSVGDWV